MAELRSSKPPSHTAPHIWQPGAENTQPGPDRNQQPSAEDWIDSYWNRERIASVLLSVCAKLIGLHFYIRFKISYVLPELQVCKRWKHENELKNATNHIGIVDAAPRVSWKTIILPSYYHSHHQISQPNLIPSAPSSSQQPPSHKYLNCPPFVSTPIIPSLHTSHFTGIHFINTSHLCICIMQLSRFIFFSSLVVYFPAPGTSGLTIFYL